MTEPTFQNLKQDRGDSLIKDTSDSFKRLILEKYKPIKIIASGGFGSVFLATQRTTGQYVAIKTLTIDKGESKEKTSAKTERFKQEITLCAALQHPNIVRILDSGEGEKGEVFIVFEYIEGLTLADLIKKEGALAIERSGKLMLQVLDGIRTAHGNGIVHRDLKPENIMIIQTGTFKQAKILDFGIGTFVSGQAGNLGKLTGSRDFLGTPMYAAPEQLRGEPVSPKCDLYSWGLLLLECLTGKPPFTGSSVAEVVRDQLSDHPVSLPILLQEHKLGTFFDWVLNKNPGRRAGDAAVVLSRFREVPTDAIQNEAGFLVELDEIGNTKFTEIKNIANDVNELDERRQITALCLSMGLDYDDAMIDQVVIEEVFDNINDICIAMIEQAGGHIEGQVGDNIMAVFGYPDIRDTDARRAIGIAMRIMTSMTQRSLLFKSQHNIDLTVSMGLHTGMVTLRKKRNRVKIVGMTQHLAGNLCKKAPRGNIYISADSYALMKSYLKCEPVADCRLPLPSKTEIYKVIEEELVEGVTGNVDKMVRFTLVGRENELVTLKRQYRNGGIPLLIQGEAGIGKSRLVAELVKQIQEEGNRFIEFKCVPEGRKSALFPILEIIRKYFGISAGKSDDESVASLESQLCQLQADPERILPLLCYWLGIHSEKYPISAVSPQKQLVLLLTVLVDLFNKIGEYRSCAYIVEDLHWADSTTLEFLNHFIEKLSKPLFLVMTARPVFKPQWKKGRVELLELGRLMDMDIENIIRDVSESVSLPGITIDEMVDRSDGVPLFAKELTRMFVESERKARRDTGFKTSFEIPNTLRELLAGRLDKLGSAKESAQLAGAIGRRFDYRLLAQLSLRDESILLADLDQMLSNGIIHIQHRAGDTPIYYFHHSLVRDTAYDSLTAQQKIKIHGRIAAIIERDFKEVIATQPEVVARHWANAAQYPKAADYGLMAAGASLSKSLFGDALAMADEAIDWTAQESENESSLLKLLKLRQVIKSVHMATKGYASDELQQTLLEIETICRKLPSSATNLFHQLFDIIVYYVHLPNYQKVEQLFPQALKIIEEYPDSEQQSLFYSIRGYQTFLHGELDKAKKELNKALEYHNEINHKDQFLKYGHDSKITTLSVKGLLCSAMNLADEAENAIEEGLRWAELLDNPQLKGFVTIHKLGMLHYHDKKELLAKELHGFIRFVERFELMAWQIIANLYDAWCRSDLQSAESNIEVWQQAGLNSVASYWNFLVAQIEYDTGLYEAAVVRLSHYIDYAERNNELYYLPELYRLKGVCLQTERGNQDQAKACIMQSIALADQTGAVLFKNRSQKDLEQGSQNFSTSPKH